MFFGKEMNVPRRTFECDEEGDECGEHNYEEDFIEVSVGDLQPPFAR
jgi:hypothetical protein